MKQTPNSDSYIPDALHFRRKKHPENISTTLKTQTKSNILNCQLCKRTILNQRVSSMINHELYKKYSSSQNYYHMKDINAILSDNRVASAIFYKDILDMDKTQDERLRRMYFLYEYEKKIAQLGEYYKYHQEIPRIFAKEQYDLYFDYHDKKRRLDYIRITEMLKKTNPEYKNEQKAELKSAKKKEYFSPVLKDLSSFQAKNTDQSSTMINIVEKLADIVTKNPSTSFSLTTSRSEINPTTKDSIVLQEEKRSKFLKKNPINKKISSNDRFNLLKRIKKKSKENINLSKNNNINKKEGLISARKYSKDSKIVQEENLDYGQKIEWFKKFEENKKVRKKKDSEDMADIFMSERDKGFRSKNLEFKGPKIRNPHFNWTKLDKKCIDLKSSGSLIFKNLQPRPDKDSHKNPSHPKNASKRPLKTLHEKLEKSLEKEKKNKKYLNSLKEKKKYKSKKRHQKTKSEFNTGYLNRIDSKSISNSGNNFQFLIRRKKSSDKENSQKGKRATKVKKILESSKDRNFVKQFESINSARVDHNIHGQEYNLFKKNRGSKNSIGHAIRNKKKDFASNRSKSRFGSLNDFNFLRSDKKGVISQRNKGSSGKHTRNKSSYGSKNKLKHKYTKSEPESLKLIKMRKKLLSEEMSKHKRVDSNLVSSHRSYKFKSKALGFFSGGRGSKSKR